MIYGPLPTFRLTLPGAICLDPDTLQEAFEGIDIVYHVAGQVSIASAQEQLVWSVNVDGTRNVIAACIKTGVRRLVYCSSIHALVEPPAGTTVDESCGFDPGKSRGGYDRSKAQASLDVLKAVKQGLNAVIACPTGVIGPLRLPWFDHGQSHPGPGPQLHKSDAC